MHLYSVGRKIYQKVKKNPVFANIIFLKEKYNQWFWSERLVDKVIFERKRREKIPFIIRRYAQDMGIGSYIISNLSQIDYAEKKGYKPVIDMKNYNGTVVDGHVENTWTLFFEQQEDELTNAYKSKNYWLSDGENKNFFPNDSMFFLNDKNLLLYWKNIYRKYCCFNRTVKDYSNREYKELLKGKGRILGVLCRGTDYVRLCPKGHPVQPDTSVVIEKAKRVMEEFKCNFIYLATEDYNVEILFRKKLGNKVIVNKRVYKRYLDGYLANTLNERENDRYNTNLEYLSSLSLLSKCDCLIAGRTSGTVVTMLMNQAYDYTFFWDLGVY
jgi:hypothetical protein